MPRLSAATPKYRLHRASGQAVVTIAGKDHYLGPWKSKGSKVEYDRLIGEWLAAGRPTAEISPPSLITVRQVIAAFWQHAKEHYRKHGRPTGTADNYKPVLSLLKARYGHKAAIEFGPIALKALRAAMIEAGQSRRYVNENVHRIRKVFKWAASEQLIPSSIPQALTMVEGLRKGQSTARDTMPVAPIADAVVEATLPYLPAIVADMVRFQRLTGARPGEVCGMRPADIDRSEQVWRYTPSEHKTEHHGRRRTIFIGPKAQALILPYLLRDEEDYCFSPMDSEKKRRRDRHAKRVTPLSCGNRPGTNRRRRRLRSPGDCYTNDSYRRAIARGCEIAFGMPEELRVIPATLPEEVKAERRKLASQWREAHVWFPHQLRHSAATQIRHKFGLEAAQVALGHSRMNVTEIYAEKNLDLATQVALAVG